MSKWHEKCYVKIIMIMKTNGRLLSREEASKIGDIRFPAISQYTGKIVCGIYSITLLLNGKKYIGKTINIIQRYNFHNQLPENLITPCDSNTKLLYKAFSEHGKANFLFEVLDTENSTSELELLYINYYNTYNPKYGYNVANTKGISSNTIKLVNNGLKGSPFK